MSHSLIQPTLIDKYKQSEDDEFELLMKMPKGYSKNDPQIINAFCQRMKEIRLIRNREAINECPKEDKPIRKGRLRGQKDLALVLGLSEMAISKYESYDESRTDNKIQNQEQGHEQVKNTKADTKVINKTKIKSIPEKHLRRICSFYDVTPHYILGYVEEFDDVLWLDKDRNIQYIWDENEKKNKPKVLKKAMSFLPSYEVECIEEYKNLSISNNELYILINKLILTKDKHIQDICQNFLSVVLDS